MKKQLIALAFLAVLVMNAPLFAQTISPENSSEYYYVSIRLEKVYPSKDGYILQYRKGVNELGRVAVPNDWFTFAASKAELLKLPPGKNWPTMTVFYKNGEFSHVRLYVHRSKAHPTWGNIPQNADVSSYFAEPENFKIEF
jgi:hypothetical protein